MQALVFRYSLPRFALATLLGLVSPRAYLSRWGPLAMQEIPEPGLPAGDWVILKTRVCGICGSDSKEVFLDGDFDNPIRSLITFPHVLGHEVVGEIERCGPAVKARRPGERVVLNPWLSCRPRGIDPPCEPCQRGDLMLCQHFTEGNLASAIHLGNCQALPGGYAPRLAAHESQLFAIPDGVPDETAVLADPFSVSLHGILKAPPAPGDTALVYGCGTLGLLAIAILRALYPSTCVAAIARYDHQAALAREMGAAHIIRARKPAEVIEQAAGITGARVYTAPGGMPWLLDGVGVIYDTIGSPESLAVGVRAARPRASIVVTGVARAARFEWTPLYFKEIAILGSNAFGAEEMNGQRRHAFEFYLDMAAAGRFDLARLITHRFRLDEYQAALLVAHAKGKHRAVKVIFEF